MLKRHYLLLEKAFALEIDRAFFKGPMKDFPLQLGNNKAVRECVEQGYLEARSVSTPTPLGPMKVSGHELTHFGRALYCMSPEPSHKARAA